MRRVLTKVRCVPRYGYEYASMRLIDVDLPQHAEPEQIERVVDLWFRQHGLAEAVFAIELDDDGHFAVINDETFLEAWGEKLF